MIREKIIENVGIIYLDRPSQLNALNTEMIKNIKSILLKWEKDDTIKAVLFDSLSEKGFSAGGDLKEIYNDYLANDNCDNKAGFFKIEFDLDKYVNSYKKPIISHWFGITMGGGIGLTINSDFIIADESINWAMPETRLGFTPDVGVGHYISNFPQALGQYIGLLGISLSAYDLRKYGLVDLVIEPTDYEKLLDILFDLSKSYEGQDLLERFTGEVQSFGKEIKETDISKDIELIEKYFSYPSFKDLYENLEDNLDDAFASGIYKELNERDFFILTLQFEKYFAGKNLTLEETIDIDLKILDHAIKTKSINEGIRSTIIDKGTNPTWPVKSIDDVNIEEIKSLLKIDQTKKEN